MRDKSQGDNYRCGKFFSKYSILCLGNCLLFGVFLIFCQPFWRFEFLQPAGGTLEPVGRSFKSRRASLSLSRNITNIYFSLFEKIHLDIWHWDKKKYENCVFFEKITFFLAYTLCENNLGIFSRWKIWVLFTFILLEWFIGQCNLSESISKVLKLFILCEAETKAIDVFLMWFSHYWQLANINFVISGLI